MEAESLILFEVGVSAEHLLGIDALLVHQQDNQRVQKKEQALLEQRPHRLD